MKVSDNCLKLIRESEGFRERPYLCPAGVPTIGYGNTRYVDGKPVRLTDGPCTRDQADYYMTAALAEYEAAVNRYVVVPLTQSQFDALVDFAYNCGAQNLRTSTLLKMLNNLDYVGAAAQFDRWVNGGGKRLPGLVTRRRKERTLFEQGIVA
jgi:lysozyme